MAEHRDVDCSGEVLKEFQRYAEEMGIALGQSQLEQVLAHMEEVLRWNRKMNLTRILEPMDFLVRHVLDSLIATRFLAKAEQIMDVGSGAGLPGIPVKIWKPEMRVFLVESRRKKAAFLKHVRRTLGLEGLEVLCERVEDACLQGRFRNAPVDVMITRATLDAGRAVAAGDEVVGRSGMIILMVGRLVEGEMERIHEACAVRQRGIHTVMQYRLPGMSEERNLVVIGGRNSGA